MIDERIARHLHMKSSTCSHGGRSMGKGFRTAVAASAVAAVVLFLLWRAFSPNSLSALAGERPPLRVIVGIAPVANLVEQVGGDRVKVEVLAPTGACSHQLSLSPKESQSLAKADLLLTINMPFERQLVERLRQTGSKVACVDISPVANDLSAPTAAAGQADSKGAATTPAGASRSINRSGAACPHGCEHDHEAVSGDSFAGPSRLNVAERAEGPRAASNDVEQPARPIVQDHSHEAQHEHSCGDPNCHEDHHDGQTADLHIWLDPTALPRLVENIAAALSAADDANAALFRRNQQMVQRRIDALAKQLDEQLRPLAGQSIYVYHPSLGYLCKAYGLRQIAVEHDGKSPSAKHLRSLIQRAQAERVRAVFVEPSGDHRAAAAVAQAIGAKLVVFDPMAPDVLTNLAQAAEQICRHQTD